MPIVTALDKQDGDLTNLVELDDGAISFYIELDNEYIFTEEGTYIIKFSVIDSDLNEAVFILTIIVSEEVEIIFSGYYESLNGLNDEDLIAQLQSIIRIYNIVSYGDARYILEKSDLYYLTDYESVRGMYNDDVIANYWIGQGAGAWQREHVWPNSKLGIVRVDNNSKNQGSDLHNLRAITGINQTRSNRYFAAGSGNAKTVGSDGFYPGDDHKGDVARILFYMDMMYDFLTLTDDVSLLGNNSATNYTLAGAYQGLLSLLVDWHLEDPVDQFEIDRNNFIYNGVATRPGGGLITPQGNRNPFIDYPELVNIIYVN